MDFAGKVVLVTGGGRGIGAAIARAFAAEKALVAVNYLRDAAAAEQVAADCRAAGGDAFAVQADVTVPEQVARMVEQVVAEAGRIDVLVNNALRPYAFDPEQRKTFEALSFDDYRAQFEGAVGAAHHVSKAVLPHFAARAQGSIVNIVSNLVEHPLVPYHDYTTAKAALVGFSRNLAAELGPLGVRVNCVAPGLVYPTSASGTTRARFRDDIAAATPLRRIARPEDVAGPVLFLASDWSGFMTGQVLFVDGGLVMR
ncbi:SDR family oxidoreductase [Ramlibacter sp. XY19]|uniref:SDR family oxidoreductase n=1 Tax=Ramlibacter paludis TaxID=2908000 RepID=UPI0023DAC034|nr:SDR family oxidoreductase [Ramlibacter paludis]MCG2591560.1 SDR family oxidoreductase [Ramlibacter paludis]